GRSHVHRTGPPSNRRVSRRPENHGGGDVAECVRSSASASAGCAAEATREGKRSGDRQPAARFLTAEHDREWAENFSSSPADSDIRPDPASLVCGGTGNPSRPGSGPVNGGILQE